MKAKQPAHRGLFYCTLATRCAACSQASRRVAAKANNPDKNSWLCLRCEVVRHNKTHRNKQSVMYMQNLYLWKMVDNMPSDDKKIDAIGNAIAKPDFKMDQQDVEMIAGLLPIEFNPIRDNMAVYSLFVEKYRALGCSSDRANHIVEAIEYVKQFR
jgi:hypothetical protein